MRRAMVLAVALAMAVGVAQAGPRTITYQGYVLRPDGNAVGDGTYQMRFRLFDTSTATTVRWEETEASVTVYSGLFSVTLGDGATPFGTLFATSSILWLEVAIDLDKNSTFETTEVYAPRQRLAGAAWAVDADTVDGKHAADLGDITGVTAGTGLTGGGTSGSVTVAVRFAGNGVAGTAARSDHAHGTSYWSLAGNAGLTSGTHFLGTTDNVALDLRANNSRVLRLEFAGLSPNILGGFSGNNVISGVYGAVIAGGGGTGKTNSVTDSWGAIGGGLNNRVGDNAGTVDDSAYATIAGGRDNRADGIAATVGGGDLNRAYGPAAAVGGGVGNMAGGTRATVGGGAGNGAMGYETTVGGGESNIAGGAYGTIGGGSENLSGGSYSTVPGGSQNTAGGQYSFAAGREARALHDGTFVWGDSRDMLTASTGANQFLIRAGGGVGINTTSLGGFGLRVAGTAGLDGTLNMGPDGTSAEIVNLADPTTSQSAATKAYVDSRMGGGGGITWVHVTGMSHLAEANRGYVADNASSLVTILLPTSASLAIGDVIRVSGAGAGGWKIAQQAGQSIRVGNIATLWIPRESNRQWYGVATSADGTKLVASVYAGQIYTSSDSGVTWTARESNRNWRFVASSADGTNLIATVENGQIYTSSDSGATWTARESNRNWERVASSADGTKLVACVSGGQIYTSSDSGVTWTAREFNRQWRSVASAADGTKLVACVSGGQIYTSWDSGTSWTARDTMRAWYGVASAADGTKLVACTAGGQIYTSWDSGVTWTARETNRNWCAVASSSDGTKLVAGIYGGQIYASSDSGVSWTARESNRDWRSVASSADGTKLVACVAGGQIYTYRLHTVPGPSGWLSGGQGDAVELQYIGANVFLPITYVGSLDAN